MLFVEVKGGGKGVVEILLLSIFILFLFSFVFVLPWLGFKRSMDLQGNGEIRVFFLCSLVFLRRYLMTLFFFKFSGGGGGCSSRGTKKGEERERERELAARFQPIMGIIVFFTMMDLIGKKD